MPRRSSIVLVGATAAVFVLVAAGATRRSPGAVAAPGAATVVRVVDGDTLRVRVGATVEPVRLIGVDTPETHGRNGLRECFGEEAARRTASLLPPGTAVVLARDVEPRDRYGRLLAYVRRAGDGLFVNLALAHDGFAAALALPPNLAHADAFFGAAAAAREAGVGLWGRCGGPDTPI